MVSIPFIAGQWSLPWGVYFLSTLLVVFQSPSLRGSGRFSARGATPRGARRSFNPLHCGAVVASIKLASYWDGSPFVSIPFIAGQWSLPSFRARSSASCLGFNPLHCGAVVASFDRPIPPHGGGQVSIPFIAGQWSLPWRSVRYLGTLKVWFQSPSLRGSGRFKPTERL